MTPAHEELQLLLDACNQYATPASGCFGPWRIAKERALHFLTAERMRSTMPPPKTYDTFGAWLFSYDGSGPVDDLAREFRKDCNTYGKDPAYFRTPGTLRVHMIQQGACPDALTALGEATRIWEALPKAA